MGPKSKDLAIAVEIMKKRWGLRCTLSEILTLRRYVLEAERLQPSSHCSGDLSCEIDPSADAVARLFYDYYGIDYTELHYKSPSGRVQWGMFSSLVSKDNFAVSSEFKEYLRGVQQRMYAP